MSTEFTKGFLGGYVFKNLFLLSSPVYLKRLCGLYYPGITVLHRAI